MARRARFWPRRAPSRKTWWSWTSISRASSAPVSTTPGAGSRRNAAALAKNLKVDLLTVPIEPEIAAYRESLKQVFASSQEDVTEENIQSRIRGTVLMALSNKFSWLVLTTGNKSELSVGYATLYGDMAGGV